MYRIAVCDDNVADGQHTCHMVRDILKKRNIEAQLSLFGSPKELLADMEAEGDRYDLFLLDILMGETNGIELAQILRDKGSRARLIYTTSSRDYALDGYKVQANDYLLKPVEKEKLDAALRRVLPLQKMLLAEMDGMLKTIPASDVRFAEAYGHYVILQMANGKEPIRLRATLTEIQKKLGREQFARCHKGYLVNLAQVQEIRNSQILLNGGEVIPLGRQYRYELKKEMIQYVEQAILL